MEKTTLQEPASWGAPGEPLGPYEEVALRGHTVDFQAAGEGPLLVLLHGITSTSEAWREVMPTLAERYTVIAPDMIGHGRSAKPRGDYSLGAYAAGVRDLLGLLGGIDAGPDLTELGTAPPSDGHISPTPREGLHWIPRYL